jgi:hypothetical protein
VKGFRGVFRWGRMVVRGWRARKGCEMLNRYFLVRFAGCVEPG